MHVFGKLTTPYVMFESEKTQLLIAHQKEEIDRTKKSFLVGQKKYSLGLEDFAHDFGKLTTPYVMF